ncbi:dynamin-related protein 4C-like [Andrographis paniculata]|uniref:dynamin-related protein 4C-like n=1 Tax=Andrographis paniculata TaxID=175694 RepID=UPI0021E8D3E4|nr:dynamin-related protein 4C-like [Andrographis paniculata]
MSCKNSRNSSSDMIQQKMAHVSIQEAAAAAPIVSSYNDRIRPLLDAVDRLRNLKIMQEGIQLPTIVVVGDQSSGKSSVLESLAGISLPRGQGICTRVPLIMRLQNHSSPNPEFFLEYDGKVVQTDEENIPNSIVMATDEIAGDGKGISDNPLTLTVKKNGVPDLTMVDLPGITRVPVHGQPEDIYEQISSIIMEYITPEESIILNVLSASVDFTTCESIRMSQRVDKTGQRTLAVVTKADKAPEGLLEKVTADDVNIGLGYVCVRNRIGEETYEEARGEESRLFEKHPLLSKISKSMVGIPVLAQKLVQIQATIIVKCLPDIVKKIDEKLTWNIESVNKLPKVLTSVSDALTSFMSIIGSAKESLRKILLRGEYDEYPDEKEMHSSARLAELLDKFSGKIQADHIGSDSKNQFLIDEISVLAEAKSIQLPNFLPRTAFLTLLQRKIKCVSAMPFECVDSAWTYIGNVVVSVLMKHAENYPQLVVPTKRAAQNLIARRKQHLIDMMKDLIEMEKLTDYTCNPEYMVLCNKFISFQPQLMRIMEDYYQPSKLCIDDYGEVDVAHLRSQGRVVQEAFDLKMRLVAYWKVALKRMVDNLALHMMFGINNLVNKDLEKEIIEEVMGKDGRGLDRMLGESPSISEKRKRFMNSIELLKESKDVVSDIMDTIASDVDY